MQEVLKKPATNMKNTRAAMIGVGVAVAVVVVACTAVLAVYLTRVEDKLEWVSYNGHYGDSLVSMDEEAEVDKGKKLILVVSADGMEVGVNNSMTLSDYKVGLQAIKIVGLQKECFIQDIEETFEEALESFNSLKETGDSGPRPTTSKAQGELIPQEEHAATIGQDLANFCRGIPTYRLVDVSESSRKRRGIRITVCVGRWCVSVRFGSRGSRGMQK